MQNSNPISESAAYLKASSLCARSEQCSYDIMQKLLRWGLDEEKAGTVLKRLIDEQFIDDARYARAFVNDKSKFQGWGKIKIEFGLRKKYISSSIIADVIGNIDSELSEENLRKILKSKARSLKENDPYKRKASLFRFAASRGYESAMISRVLPDFIGNIEDDSYDY